jgi:hypothetical protein
MRIRRRYAAILAIAMILPVLQELRATWPDVEIDAGVFVSGFGH